MAANTTKKKTSARPNSKSGTGRKKSTSSKKKNQITLDDVITKQELKSSLIFVGGVLLLILMLFSGADGTVWNKIRTFYFSVFGLCGYYIPVAVIFCAVINILNKQIKGLYVKLGEVFLLLVIICGLIHINKSSDPALGYGETVKVIYQGINSHDIGTFESGGVVGALFGGLFFQIGKSKIIANIISFIFLFADLMFMFGITLFKVFSKMEQPAKKVTEYTGDAIEKTKTEYEQKKKELAEYRAKRAEMRRSSDINPAKIVDDFYNTPESVPDTPAQNNSKKASADNGNQDNIFSIFSQTADKTEDSPSEAVQTDTDDIFSRAAKRANEKTSEFPVDNIISLNQDSQKKEEKIEPLSDSEANELKKELDSSLVKPVEIEYQHPPMTLLNMPVLSTKAHNETELKSNGEKLIAALESFNVQASIVDVVPGPTVTRYELSPAPGVKISKFVGLADDLALHLAAPSGLRIEAPIPNKAAIGIEIPNRNKTTVTFREIIDTDAFRKAKSKLNVALGKDISGTPMFSDIAKMPHLLVAGTTGSGKSVCLNSMIVSLLYNASPDEVKILLIDPKQVEFGVYNGLPHLLVPVVSDPRKASGALGWAVTEMLNRYKTLNANGVRDIGAYNSLCDEREDLQKMSQIVIFIDELSDLMTVAQAEVEDSIQRLAQMARAAGMHLVVATQRPSVDVITGVIKANIPSRIALTVKSQIDSRTIIDSSGAEKLMGYGDMLYYPVGIPKPVRIQGCYLTDKEIEGVVSFIKANGSAKYDDTVQQEIDRQAAQEKKKGSAGEQAAGGGIDSGDELLMRAIELFVSAPEKASISALQRHLGLGFAKAGRVMDTLEKKGIVGPHEGSKPRKVLITKSQWYEMNAMNDSQPDNANEDGFDDISEPADKADDNE